MIGFIYQITNKVNGKIYIGKTNDLNRRISKHYSELRGNYHHSHKLQRAYNKYGEENFIVTYEQFNDITEEELSQKEIETIEKFDSYYNGYNETLGGEGHSLLFDFNTTILIYQLGQRYNGIKKMLGRYFNCDSSTIAAIMNKTYLKNIEYKQEDLNDLINKIGINDDYLKENYKNNYTRKFSKEQVFQILSGIELKGYSQSACAQAFGLTKDLVQKIVTGKTYKQDKKEYEELSNEDKQFWLEQFEINTKITILGARKMSKIKITQDIVDYIMDHKDIMTQKDIGEILGIDRKRVGRIILKQTYSNLVEDWEKRHSIH